MKQSPDVLTLYGRALDIADPRARKLFLDTCPNAEIRAELEALLQAEQQAGSQFLQLPTIDPDLADDPTGLNERPAESIGSTIGRYRLVENLGAGGMGSVYRAEQLEPVRRTVALKVIKAGLDSGKVFARFETERQALAMMDHENIARVFDGGTTPAGQPYFVMELVEGVPLTKYCDKAHVPLRARLGLFTQVCKAIQHAHQKGVIHRDIKPSNVLVTLKDGKAVVKVIDFGVAKAIGQNLTDQTSDTLQGAIIGTLEYMSPEQADPSSASGSGSGGIDARSDIYSLGVLLYELLTGTTPLDHSRLIDAALLAVLSRIRQEDPPRPSTRITTSFEAAKKITASWKIDPKKLAKELTGDLDWIAMKALEKDRTRRYETANALVRDVERYLNDEPVEACPPRLTYIAGKFVRKHKGPVAAAAAVIVALLAGLAVSVTLYYREKKALGDAVTARATTEAARAAEQTARIAAETARAAAETARVAAVKAEERETRARKEAEASAKKAETEAARNEQTADFLGKMLYTVSPEEAKGQDTTLLKNMLDEASKQVGVELAGQPEAEANLRNMIGITYLNLGLYPQAQLQLETGLDICTRLLEPDELNTLVVMNNLAKLYTMQGKFSKAETLMAKVLEISRRLFGPEHEATLGAMGNLASVMWQLLKYEAAEKLAREELEIEKRLLGLDHTQTLTTMDTLADFWRQKGLVEEAETMQRQILEIRKRVQGLDHPDALGSLGNLALTLRDRRKFREAESLFREKLKRMKRVLSADHPSTLATQAALAQSLHAEGKYPDAEALYRETLEIQRRMLGKENIDALATMTSLAAMYDDQHKYAEAAALQREAIENQTRLLGPEHVHTLRSILNLASICSNQGNHDEALALYLPLLDTQKRVLGAGHPDTLAVMELLAKSFEKSGKSKEAEELRKQVLEIEKLAPNGAKK